MSTLKLTQGSGISLKKSGTDLIITAEGGGAGSSNCYVHRFTASPYGPTLVIDDETAQTMFEEASITNAIIIIKLYSSTSQGASEKVYVYDGTFTPSGGAYSELGFMNTYQFVNGGTGKVISSIEEIKLKREYIESTGTYQYTTSFLTPTIDPVIPSYKIWTIEGSTPEQTNYPSDPYAYDVIKRVTTTGAGSGGATITNIRWFHYAQKNVTNGTTTLRFKNILDTTEEITATKASSATTWTWAET